MALPANLLPTRIDRAEYAATTTAGRLGITGYFLEVPPGVTPAHIVDPDFWMHVARQMRVYDRIEIVAADGSFDADLRVMAVDPGLACLWAQVRVLRMCDGEGVPIIVGKPAQTRETAAQWPDREGYAVEFNQVHKWRILQGANLVAKDFPDEGSAIAALANIKAAKRKAA